MLNLRVFHIEQLSPSVKRITLTAIDQSLLPGFSAGAHLSVNLKPGSDELTRKYSLISKPSDLTHYQIAVLLNQPSTGGSEYIHNKLKVGDEITAEPPINGFSSHRGDGPALFIAGGIGVTPIFALAREMKQRNIPYQFHYAGRSLNQMAMVDDIKLLGGGQLNLYPNNEDGSPAIRLESVIAKHDGTTHLYVCGPVPLINSVISLCEKSGWPSSFVHFESFGSKVASTDVTIQLELTLSNIQIEVSPGKTILKAIEEAGVWAPADCLRGECGTCITQIIEGEVDHRDVCMTEAQRKSAMCTCVSWLKPTSPGQRLKLEI